MVILCAEGFTTGDRGGSYRVNNWLEEDPRYEDLEILSPGGLTLPRAGVLVHIQAPCAGPSRVALRLEGRIDRQDMAFN